MASVKQNILKFKGKIGGLSFYQLNGKDVVRKSYGPSADVINTNPNYSSIKKNNKEFAGATQVSKLIRNGLGNIGKEFQDTYMASRLTGACRNIISNGKGQFGQRESNLNENHNKLIGFSLIKNTPLKNICKTNYEIQTSKNQKQVILTLPNVQKSDFTKKIKYATHFKITMLIVYVSKYKYHTKQDKYLPYPKQNNGLSIHTTTNLLPINQDHKELILSLNINPKNNKNSNQALTIWLGVSTYYLSNQEEESIANNKAMQCLAIL